MADPISIFGRKPGMPDTGYGEMLAGRTIASVMGTVNSHARIVKLAGRIGKNTATNATAQFAAYTLSGSAPSARIARTAAFTVSNTMYDHSQGADISQPVEAYAKVNAGTSLALAMSAQTASMSYGMGEWGHTYYEDYVAPTPATFSSDNTRPEGKNSFWAELVYNRAPVKPGIVQPLSNGQVTDLTPTLECSFDDPDITLDALPGQTCDFLTKYQFEIWTANANGTKVTRIRDTGVLNATQAQKDAKKASYTTPTNLSAGKYVATCTFWDEFGEPSPRQEWIFTVVSGGAITDFNIASYEFIQPGMIDALNANFSFTWVSPGGASTSTLQLTVRRPDGSTVSGPNGPYAFTIAAGATGTTSITALGHPQLTRGLSYYLELQVTDSTGQVSPVARTPEFRVKGIPPVPTLKTPAHGAGFIDPPTLMGTMGADDGSVTINPEFGIRTLGSETWTVIPSSRAVYTDGDYYVALGTADLPTKTTWEWSMRAVDAYGAASAWATARSFVYTDPPTVTITGVTEGETIATGQPTFTLTSPTAFVAYSYAVFNTTQQKTVYTSGRMVVSSRTSHTFPLETILLNTNSYMITFTVETAQAITGSATRSFTVNYPPVTAVTSLQTEVVAGPMESVNEPQWWSRVRVTWAQVPVGTSPDANFAGYVLERRSLETGELELRRYFRSRTQTSFLDVTPRSGVQYNYTLYWLHKPDGINIVSATSVTVQNGVTLKGATLSSLNDENLGAPIYAFSSRRPDWGSADAVTIHETWGELPIAFQSLNRGDVISGTFIPMDDPYGQYTHRQVTNNVKEMSQAIVDSTGVPRPQAVYYRDGVGRAGAFVISGPSGENDREWLNANELNLTLTQVRVSMIEVGP